MRCVHEAQLHEENAFITLTYAPENVPPGGTLIKKDFQDFAKRLRKKFADRKIKYFHCGEYGDRTGRPHYHALLFGLDFADKRPWKKSADGSQIFTSEILSGLWPAGFCTTGAVTFESAAYVARYVMKKITGARAKKHYETVDPDTGEVTDRLPEYTTMSLKGNAPGEPGGIAAAWYKQFKGDVFPSDFVVVRGQKMKPPKFYDRLLELEDPEARAVVRESRMAAALKRDHDNSTARLLVREKVKIAQTKLLKRETE